MASSIWVLGGICLTPFGAGIGAAVNTMPDFSNYNPVAFGLGENPSEWHLAYAAYAGVSYGFAKDWKLDFSYTTWVALELL